MAKVERSYPPKFTKTKLGITEKESEIAKEFNKYFNSVGTALENKIPTVTKDVSEYLPQCNASMKHKELFFQKFEKAFKELKRNKANACHAINGDIIFDVCDSVRSFSSKILKHFLKKQSFQKN